MKWIPKTSSGHYLFIAPWEGRTIVGTTDTDYAGPTDEVRATRADVDYLLRSANTYFPSAKLEPRSGTRFPITITAKAAEPSVRAPRYLGADR